MKSHNDLVSLGDRITVDCLFAEVVFIDHNDDMLVLNTKGEYRLVHELYPTGSTRTPFGCEDGNWESVAVRYALMRNGKLYSWASEFNCTDVETAMTFSSVTEAQTALGYLPSNLILGTSVIAVPVR